MKLVPEKLVIGHGKETKSLLFGTITILASAPSSSLQSILGLALVIFIAIAAAA